MTKTCRHLDIAHCGGIYMCLSCGSKGEIIRSIWEGRARR